MAFLRFMLTSSWWPSNSLRRLLQHPHTSSSHSGTACIPHPSPKRVLNALECPGCKLWAALQCDSPWVHPGVATLISANPLPTQLMSYPSALLQQWALLLNDDVLHAKATLHYSSFQSCFPWIFLGLKAERLSRSSPALTPAYIFHCISSWLPSLI